MEGSDVESIFKIPQTPAPGLRRGKDRVALNDLKSPAQAHRGNYIELILTIKKA